MASPRENLGTSSPSSPPSSVKRSREAAGFTSDDEHRPPARGGRRIDHAGDDGDAAWYVIVSFNFQVVLVDNEVLGIRQYQAEHSTLLHLKTYNSPLPAR